MLLYILSRLGSICQGLASTEAWHAILYLVTLTPWQYPQKDQPPKTQAKEQSRTAKAQAPKTPATKAQVEQTQTCRRAGVRDTL